MSKCEGLESANDCRGKVCGARNGSEKRSPKEKAIVDLLENDLFEISNCVKLVWPLTGIVANIPTRPEDNGQYVGEISESEVRDEFITRGINCIQVEEVRGRVRGRLGTALVKFNKSWRGLYDILSFETAYEEDRRRKEEWLAETDSVHKKSGLYTWIAKEDDYNLGNEIRARLQEIGDLKTPGEIADHEVRKKDKLASSLTRIVVVKNENLKKMELKYGASSISLKKLKEERDKIYQAENEEIKKIQSRERDHLERILHHQRKLKSEFEFRKMEHKSQWKEFKRRKEESESERKRLAVATTHLRACYLQLAANLKKQKADEKFSRMIDDQRENFERKALEFEKTVDKMHSLELEAEQLIKALQNVSIQAKIGVKRIGEVDLKPILEVMKRKYDEEEAEVRALEFCSTWQEHVEDQSWYPFKFMNVKGKNKEFIDEGDKKLKSLRMDLGQEVYEAVKTALIEMKEYNPNDREIISELWNFEAGRKASLGEGIAFMLKKTQG
ncbi:hypothetical protein TIFTF001_010705 [Ficus carica]|uniref:Factor of DNA methylation 1-5/IDN2 domain-containing protein n=1 Tax=Ficus carica TaxID=3494 RepID=A0AA88D3L8_FICCA|nr:hypothetical protein TIFTF001_010705 [Ficus carica]